MTDWFPGGVKPTREGVYEATHGGWQHGYARFEDGLWQFLQYTVEDAADVPFSHGASQDKEWRGFAKRQKGKA